ncbi:MAG TPA: M48 family metallopeptidase [Thermoanaerobaculia bacterium]|nr:M48 family metallopeptidase [Thermoanaerobaculia bacterium]
MPTQARSLAAGPLARLALCALLALAAAAAVRAATPPAPPVPAPVPAASSAPSHAIPEGPVVPAAARPVPGRPFDPVQATEAWLAQLSPAQRARSDAYFEGGYWLQLWDFLYGLAIAWLLLGSGFSVRLRDGVERLSRFRFVQVLSYSVVYIVAGFVLSLPLGIYEGYFREHRYGMANQTFGPWMGDQMKGLLVAVVLGGLALTALYAVLRRFPRTWWVWGAVLAVVFVAFVSLIAPVFIEPLFNDYTELKDPAIRGPILSLARANLIPADHVYVFDASKQTKRVSANVNGFAGTMRIALNDNLLARASKAAIQGVMGHEMGHYVLHHVYKGILSFGILFVAGFAFLRWALNAAFRRWSARWGLRDLADVAGLPLLIAVFSVFFFVVTPITNTLIRVDEAEADLFGVNASRQPDGMAEAALLLGEYRKLHPGPVEEFIFFDHPSGYNRILRAMTWKAEHRRDFEGQVGTP